MTRHQIGFALALAAAVATPGLAAAEAPLAPLGQRAWRHVTFGGAPAAVAAPAPLTVAFAALSPDDTPPAAQRPQAVTYSEGYQTRRKIHLVASVATLPLFVAQGIVGQKLYGGSGGSAARSAHGALTASIAALFAVNTVTGAWNFMEGRKDPNGRTRRLVHSLLMFGADLGFVATGALAPDDEGEGNRSLHRSVAITSMGLATAGYLYMLFTR